MSFVSPEAQLRCNEIHRKNDLYSNYGYAYELNDTKDLRVMHWGRPSKFEYVDCRDGLALEAATWVVFWVAVYVCDFPDPRRGHCKNSGWIFWTHYPTKAFGDIHRLFERHLDIGGVYKRVAYCIEEWEWTEQNGWVHADHV